MAPLAFSTVDAFTSTPFSGNPAAVILIIFPTSDPRSSSPSTLQKIAAEFNLSETAFATPIPDAAGGEEDEGVGSYTLRWFTPAVEVPLCGHATLATSHILFKLRPLLHTLKFTTLSGLLIARNLRSPGSATNSIALNFPADHKALKTYSVGDGERYETALAVALAAAPALDGKVLGVAWTGGGMGCLVEVAAEVDLEGLEVRPQGVIADGNPDGCLTVTKRSTRAGIDIESRLFAPGLGIDEDPVVSFLIRLPLNSAAPAEAILPYFFFTCNDKKTGAAHCYLGPYWLGTSARTRLDATFDAGSKPKMSLTARQVSKRGGGMSLSWDREAGRIDLIGEAVTMLTGSIDF
ncbi:trans-2,3-dihydro-3-hydroxyanthranilate isomerase, partial [Phenoliferia sp. Uapishka_3]